MQDGHNLIKIQDLNDYLIRKPWNSNNNNNG
jgi:hypothetical protein